MRQQLLARLKSADTRVEVGLGQGHVRQCAVVVGLVGAGIDLNSYRPPSPPSPSLNSTFSKYPLTRARMSTLLTASVSPGEVLVVGDLSRTTG